MLATILLAAFNLMTIEMAAFTGAVAVVLTGCIPVNQAYRAIDARIFVFIAGAIPLGTAMQKTGTANLIAGWLQHAVGGWPERLVLLALVCGRGSDYSIHVGLSHDRAFCASRGGAGAGVGPRA